MPKKSLYNHFQPWNDDNYIAYSARSGGVALMDSEQYAMYLELMKKLDRDEAGDLSEAETELLEQLKYGRFVRRDTDDELTMLRFQHHSTRFASDGLSLVIAPTMACNMACAYCYEENKTGKMSPEVVDAVAAFVGERGPSLRGLSVTWYGGEPLLALDIIEDLTNRFRRLAEEHKFEYGAGIVTNGYLLSRETVDRLVELKVVTGQVTLDGPAARHNEKRPLKSGKDSFSTIVENLRYALTRIPISLRVNVDQTFTSETVDQLLAELTEAGLRDRAALNFGHLEPATKVCANIAESCFETQAFSSAEADFFKLMLDRGFSINKLPAPSSVCCMAQIVNAFVVDPRGELYRCWNYVGDPERSMGNIKNPIDFQHPNFQHLFSVDPFDYEECRACNLLPLCMGGCPARRRDRNLPADMVCESWKYNLEPMLEVIAASKIREQEKAARAAAAPEQKEPS